MELKRTCSAVINGLPVLSRTGGTFDQDRVRMFSINDPIRNIDASDMFSLESLDFIGDESALVEPFESSGM